MILNKYPIFAGDKKHDIQINLKIDKYIYN